MSNLPPSMPDFDFNTPVSTANSLSSASPEFLAGLRSGLGLILNGLLLVVALLTLQMLLAMVAAALNEKPMLLQLGLQALMLGATGMTVVGYWKFSEADSAGNDDPAAASLRRLIRVPVVIQFVSGLAWLGTAIGLAYGLWSTPGASPSAGVGIVYLVALFGTLAASVVAWIVQLIGVVLYVKWLGGRVPDAFIQRRASVYAWLLPLLQTVGICVVGLGPLIALVLYWNMLDRLRKHVRAIQETGSPAILPA